MITKEKLTERLQLIEADLKNMHVNYNALAGAKAEVEHWLKQLEIDSVKE